MSDSLPAADSSVPTSDAGATVPAPLAVECPGCGAKLRNISAEPGAKIRCLNCGTRFVAIPAAEGAAQGVSPVADSAEKKAVVREPQSAGYWILRIPALIFCALALLAFFLITFRLAYEVYFRGQLPDLRHFQPFLYVVLLPLFGFFAYRATRALAWVEAGTVKAAWQGGLLHAPLPIAPGSSLPYILPLAAAPAVTLLVILVGGLKREFHRADDVVPFFLAIPAFFLLGFVCDDLRQFIWRQHALADSCTQKAGGRVPESRRGFPWLGVLLALTLGLFACTTLSFLASEYTRNYKGYGWYYDLDLENKYSGYEAMGMTSASLLCAAVTFFLLTRNFQRAVGAWWDAAQALPTRGHEAAFARQALDWPMLAFRCVVYLFLFVFAVTVIRGITRHQSFGNASAVWEFTGQIFALNATILLALSLVRLLADVRQWRKAQAHFWRSHSGWPAPPELSTPVRLAVFGTIALALLQAFVFLALQIDRVSGRGWIRNWEDWMMTVPIAMFALHAPIVWAALLSREFLLAERMAGALSTVEAK